MIHEDERLHDHAPEAEDLRQMELLPRPGVALGSRFLAGLGHDPVEVAASTAAVAHDMRNVLMVATGQLALLADRVGSCEETEALEGTLSRLTSILFELDRLRNGEPRESERFELNELVRAQKPLLDQVVAPDIALTRRLTPESTAIAGDTTQLERVLLNLVKNASDAMPLGGRIVLATEVAYGSQLGPIAAGLLVPGERYVVLSVEDQGFGVSQDLLSRIFEPCVTTKPGGQGLGLATVHGIVEGHGGAVVVDSDACGATFRVALPCPRRR